MRPSQRTITLSLFLAVLCFAGGREAYSVGQQTKGGKESAQDSNPDAVRKAISAQEQKINAALVKKDFVKISGFLTDDFVAESPKNELMSKPDYFDRLKQSLGFLTLSSAQSTIKSIKMQKGVAVVVFQNTAKGKVKQPNGKLVRYEASYQSKEHWIKKDGVWKLSYAKEMPGGTTKLDGKLSPES